jgi:hypothetical protein
VWKLCREQDEDCLHSFVLGSGRELELRFAWRSHQEDVAGGLEPHAWGQDEASTQLSRENGAWSDEFGHGVSVYLDERLVGVAQGAHFNLSGLAPGIHTLQIVARDAAGNDQEVFPRAPSPVRAVARGMLDAREKEWA